MVSGLDLARAPRRRRLTARKKGSGYENGMLSNYGFIQKLPNSQFDKTSYCTGLVFRTWSIAD